MRTNTHNLSARGAGASGEAGARSHLVGRTSELAVLEALLDAQGAMSPALIEGEAGAGKTALVNELVRKASARGVRCLQGTCRDYSEDTPLSPFLPILKDLRISIGPEKLGREREPTADLLFAAGRVAASRRVAFLSGLVDSLVQASRDTKTLLCLDDIHWADRSSLLLLDQLTDAVSANLTVVATSCPDAVDSDEAGRLLERYRRRSAGVNLKGLARDEVGELVRAQFPAWSLTSREVAELHSWTLGNPLLLLELVRHLEETALLGRHRLPEAITRCRASGRLATIIDLRLASLTSHAHETLAVCAVWGQEFSLPLAALLMNQPEAVVEQALERAVTRAILEFTDAPDGPAYRFRHPLFQKRLYDGLAASERRRLHLRIVELTRLHGVTLPAEQYSRHYGLGPGRRAGRPGVEACTRAAEEAERVLAHETAARHWELALRCTPIARRRTRAELLRRLGASHTAAGEWTAAAQVWSRSAELFADVGDERAYALLAIDLAELHRWRAELAECERWARQALGPSLVPAERARALALLGSVACLGTRATEGLRLLSQADRLARPGGGDPFVSYWRAYGYATTGQHKRSQAEARRGLKIAMQLGASTEAALLAGNLALHELTQLQVTKARQHVRLVERYAYPHDLIASVRALVCRAWLEGYGGRWDRIIALCDRWLAEVRVASQFHVATAHMFRAGAKLMLGQPSAAQSEIAAVVPDLDQMRSLASLYLALAQMDQGEIDQAKEAVEVTWRQVARSRRNTASASRTLLGEISSRLDEPRLWNFCYRLLAREDAPLAISYTPCSVQRILGRLAARLKEWPTAFHHFEVAIRDLERGEAQWELGRTLIDFAEAREIRRRRGDARKAGALRLQADALFESLGRTAECQKRVVQPGTNRFALTGRELEVLDLVARGWRNQEIAETLILSLRTVHRHVENIIAKIGAANRTDAVMRAVQEGLIGPLASKR